MYFKGKKSSSGDAWKTNLILAGSIRNKRRKLLNNVNILVQFILHGF